LGVQIDDHKPFATILNSHPANKPTVVFFKDMITNKTTEFKSINAIGTEYNVNKKNH